MNKIITWILLFLASFWVSAQSEVQMAEDFRGEGKIYVVVMVILAILFGIFFTLWRLDKKLTQLENRSKEEE